MSTISDSSSSSYAEQARYDAAEAERTRLQDEHRQQLNQVKDEAEEDHKIANAEYNKRLLQERKEAQDEVRKLKDELYSKEGRKFTNDSRDLSTQKMRLENYQDEVEKTYKSRVAKAERSLDERAAASEERKSAAIEQNMKELNRSHQLETKHLNDSLRQAMVDPRDVEKERAMAHAKAIEDVEGPSRREKENLVAAYESSIGRMRDKDEADRDTNLKRMTEIQYETMGKANKIMREQKNDFIKRDQERLAEMKQIQGDFHRQVDKEKSLAERGTEVLRMNHENQTKAAMQNQAEAFNRNYQEKKAGYDYQLGKQQAELKELKSTDSELLASPALVQRIHRGEEERYFKELSAEHQHDLNQQEGLKERDVRERREIMETYQHALAQSQNQGTRKLDQEKSLLLTGYEDLKSSKEQEVAQLRDHQAANNERSQLKHAQELNLLQKRNLATMNEQRDSFVDDSRRKVSDVEFSYKVQNRELMARMSEVARDHENKLADQALAHEMQMNELRLDFDTKLHEQERKAAQGLGERIKGYEHQLKEQELAFKDRERFLTEHYEEEIDKMKRTNARLIQKKS